LLKAQVFPGDFMWHKSDFDGLGNRASPLEQPASIP
jgi:hypothetical protein